MARDATSGAADCARVGGYDSLVRHSLHLIDPSAMTDFQAHPPPLSARCAPLNPAATRKIMLRFTPGPVRNFGPYAFQLLDPNVALVSPNIFIGPTRDCRLRDVDLTPNSRATGCIAFEVPKEGKIQVVYAPYHYEGLKEGRYLGFTIREGGS